MSKVYQQILEQHGFDIPETYRALRARGLFDPEGKNELFLTDLQWLSLLSIATSQRIDGAIPFARTTRREHFCWSPRVDHGDGAPITFHPRGESPTLYAPNFEAFIYRSILEEFSLSWLPNSFG